MESKCAVKAMLGTFDVSLFIQELTPYMQPNVKLPKPFGDYTNPSNVILSLIDGLNDSFGTLRRKQGLPSGFWEWKPPKSYLSSLPPISQFCENIMACRWNDCYK